MKKSAFIGSVFAGLFFATSCIFVYFLSDYNFVPNQMVAMRGVVAAISTVLVVLIHDRTLFKIDLRGLMYAVICGTCCFLIAIFYYISMKATSVATSVVLMYIAPIFVMIYSVIYFKEKFTRLKAAAVICIIFGCVFVSGVIGGFKFDLYGVTMGLLSGVTYGAYNIVTKIAMRQNYRPLSINVYSFITMGILAAAFGDVGRIVEIASRDPMKIIPLIIGIGICTCTLPYSLQTFCLKELPAGVASSLGVIDPLASTIYSVVLLGDKLSLTSALGVVMIVVAIFLFSKTGEKEV